MKKRIAAIAAAAVVLLLAALIEVFICNFYALSQECFREQTETLQEQAVLALEGNHYIKTLAVEYRCESDMPITVVLYDESGVQQCTVDTVIDAKLDRRVINLRTSAAKVVVTLHPDTSDRIEESAEILRIEAANFFEWNVIRLLFFAALFGVSALFLFLHGSIWERPEYLFATIALASGLMLIVITGSNQISYDEQTHVTQAWNLSYIGTVYETEAVLECKTLTVPHFSNIWERQNVEEYLESIHDFGYANVFRQSRMISYEKRAYLPLAMGIAFGRLLHLPFVWTLSLGKFFNLLMYVLICAAAIHIAQKGKMLAAVIALMPNSIFSAAQFSYDACVNGFLLLAMVLVMNELLNPHKRVRPAHMLVILVCFMVGSYPKQIYVLMALLMLFFGREKFASRSREILFKLVLTIFCLTMVYEVLAPSYSGASAAVTLAGAGDSRTEGSGMLGQIRFILGQPFAYLRLLFTSQFGRILRWLNGSDQFLMYGYLGTPGTFCTWLWLLSWLAAGVVSPTEEGRYSIGRKFIVWNLLMSICMAAVIWTVLYLSFNVIGSATIEGVQNRYFTPLFLPVGMCLMNAKIRVKLKGELYAKLLFALCALLLFYCNWKLGICAYYL